MEYKNNHYVAEMHLSRFKSEAGVFFYVDKRKARPKVEPRNPRSVFRQNHLYNHRRDDGTLDVGLERDFFRRMENDASPVFDRVVDASRSGKRFRLTVEEKALLNEYQLRQFVRVPDNHFKVPLFSTPADKSVQWAIEEHERRHGPLSEDKKTDFIRSTSAEEVVQSARVKAMGSAFPKSRAYLESHGLLIVRIVDVRKSFVIGSMPIVRMLGDVTSEDGQVAAWMPISHDVAIAPGGERDYVQTRFATDPWVRQFNIKMFDQSSEVGGRSAKLLESLMTRR